MSEEQFLPHLIDSASKRPDRMTYLRVPWSLLPAELPGGDLPQQSVLNPGLALRCIAILHFLPPSVLLISAKREKAVISLA